MTTMSDKFSGLSIEDAEPPRTRVTLAGHPVFEAFRASAETRTNDPKEPGKWTGKAKSVTITASDVIELEGIVRRSAVQLDCGAGLRFRTPDDKIVEIVSVGGKKDPKTGKSSGGKMQVYSGGTTYAGQVKVWFWAKSRRADKSATAAPTAQSATPAAQPAAPAQSKATAAPIK